MPIDIYDGATWMAVSVLSEMSIAAGGTPRIMPDFTSGKWHLRAPKDVIEFKQKIYIRNINKQQKTLQITI